MFARTWRLSFLFSQGSMSTSISSSVHTPYCSSLGCTKSEGKYIVTTRESLRFEIIAFAALRAENATTALLHCALSRLFERKFWVQCYGTFSSSRKDSEHESIIYSGDRPTKSLLSAAADWPDLAISRDFSTSDFCPGIRLGSSKCCSMCVAFLDFTRDSVYVVSISATHYAWISKRKEYRSAARRCTTLLKSTTAITWVGKRLFSMREIGIDGPRST